mmetsp:Transcript_96086/g.165672  ORF Transcript_96086/g.165672 Transcript_96086/m.165672 type:complete len:579 (-) Transcript_96086:177-1913(-)
MKGDDEYIDVIRELFDDYDTMKNGSLTSVQFMNVIRDLGISQDEAVLTGMYLRYDLDGNGVIQFDEWTEGVVKQRDVLAGADRARLEQSLADALKEQRGLGTLEQFYYDNAGGEGMSVDQFAKALQNLGIADSHAWEDIQAVFQRLDVDHSGLVDLQEFMQTVGAQKDGDFVKEALAKEARIIEGTAQRAAEEAEVAEAIRTLQADVDTILEEARPLPVGEKLPFFERLVPVEDALEATRLRQQELHDTWAREPIEVLTDEEKAAIRSLKSWDGLQSAIGLRLGKKVQKEGETDLQAKQAALQEKLAAIEGEAEKLRLAEEAAERERQRQELMQLRTDAGTPHSNEAAVADARRGSKAVRKFSLAHHAMRKASAAVSPRRATVMARDTPLTPQPPSGKPAAEGDAPPGTTPRSKQKRRASANLYAKIPGFIYTFRMLPPITPRDYVRIASPKKRVETLAVAGKTPADLRTAASPRSPRKLAPLSPSATTPSPPGSTRAPEPYGAAPFGTAATPKTKMLPGSPHPPQSKQSTRSGKASSRSGPTAAEQQQQFVESSNAFFSAFFNEAPPLSPRAALSPG